jgi:hypothetical protein
MLFMQLSSSCDTRPHRKLMDDQQRSTRFKWWFEGIDRVLANRGEDIERMQLSAQARAPRSVAWHSIA